MDPPIYQCENLQGHTVCFTCHKSLKKERRPCPVCRKQMKNRRNVTLECMLEIIPNKTKCKFNGCDLKRSDAEAVKKHEDDCVNRYVPCAKCDAEISLRGLGQHVTEEHCNGVVFELDNFGTAKPFWNMKNSLKKDQTIISVEGDDKFICNWSSLDDDLTLFWVAYIGKKALSSNYKYTLQVQKGTNETEKYAFEGTRDCIPCDLSHTDVKKKKWALLLDKDLIADATKEDNMT